MVAMMRLSRCDAVAVPVSASIVGTAEACHSLCACGPLALTESRGFDLYRYGAECARNILCIASLYVCSSCSTRTSPTQQKSKAQTSFLLYCLKKTAGHIQAQRFCNSVSILPFSWHAFLP